MPRLLQRPTRKGDRADVGSVPAELLDRFKKNFQVVSASEEDANLWHVERFVGNEAQSRVLINDVLLHLCWSSGLQLKFEKPLTDSANISGVFDYLLLDRSKRPVAVVEAKCRPWL